MLVIGPSPDEKCSPGPARACAAPPGCRGDDGGYELGARTPAERGEGCAQSRLGNRQLGEALRLEWAPEGIEVCTLDPGLTATGFFEAQPNPGGLPDPSLEGSQSAVEVARSVLALDAAPRPELFLLSLIHI